MKKMDGMLVAVIALIGLMIVAGVAIAILILVFWKEARFQRLERELGAAARSLRGMANLLDNNVAAYDAELSQLWDYVLPRKGPP